jgi:hypothetical protein
MDFIPEKSELQLENIETKDVTVRNLIKELGIRKLVPGLRQGANREHHRGGHRGGNREDKE